MPYTAYEATGGQLVDLVGSSVQPTPTAPLVGAYTTSLSNFQAFSSSAGPLRIRRVFNSNVPSSWPGTGSGNDGNAGQPWTVCQSVKAPPSEILAGTWDTAIENFVAGGPIDRPWYFTIWHEPELKAGATATAADWPDAGITFQQIHARMYPIVKAANTHVLMGPVYSYWPWRPGGAISETAAVGWRPQDWMIPGANCDFAGIDEYNASTTSGRTSLATSPSMQRWYSYVNSLCSSTKPIAVPEWGRFPNPSDPTARAQDITDSWAWLRSTGRCLFWNYWDTLGTEGDYTLTDQPSLDAWRAAAQSGGMY